MRDNDKKIGPFIIAFAEHCAWRGVYVHWRMHEPEGPWDSGWQLCRLVLDPTNSSGGGRPTLSGGFSLGNRHSFSFRIKLPTMTWSMRCRLAARFPRHEHRISRLYQRVSMFWHNLDGRFRKCPACGDRHMSVDCYACRDGVRP